MLRILLAAALVLAIVPAASATDVPVECDVDDDLVQHCNAGPIHVAYGTHPACAGARVGDSGDADCDEILSKD